MYFSPHDCPVTALFLYNYQQWIGSDLTWLPLENKCPNYLFMSFSELELALFNICNMYSNTMHLCILLEECLTCCINDWYDFLFLFFRILQYFYMHCYVGSRLGAGYSWFVKKYEKYMLANISYAQITWTEYILKRVCRFGIFQ